MNRYADLANYATKYYSQFGEAGIINRIMDIIGTANKIALEFGAGDGVSLSNTRHLADADWRVVMWDRYGDNLSVYQELVTVENVNTLFNKYEIPDDLDVLSIDIDGNDYWIWKAITAQPRLVVIEFNGTIDPAQSKTIPYDPDFVHDGTDYYGASLALLQKLATAKGYTLVYQHVTVNAFYVRSDLLSTDTVDPVTYEPFQYHPHDTLDRPWIFI